MTGYIYKEWKQHQVKILLMLPCAAVVVFFSLFIYMYFYKDSLNEAARHILKEGGTLRIMGTLVGFIAAGALQNAVLKGDDRKLWSLFVTSAPEGYKGFLRIKYELILAMILIMTGGIQLFQALFGAMVADTTGETLPGLDQVYIMLIYVQLFLRAVDLPFIVRFGSRRGSTVKMIILIILAVLITLFVVLDPADMASNAIIAVTDLMSRDNGRLMGVLTALLPNLVMAAYYLSYRISCRLYLKGVTQYDK